MIRHLLCTAGLHDLLYMGRGWRVCRHCHCDFRIGEVVRNQRRSAAWFNVGKIDQIGTPEEIAQFHAAMSAAPTRDQQAHSARSL